MKKTIPTWLSVVMLILAVAAFGVYLWRVIYGITHGYNAFVVITLILWVIVAIAALMYFLAGYKKNGAAYYEAFFITYSLVWMFMIFASAMSGFTFYIIPVVIGFGAVSILAGTKNLGKSSSYVCGIVVCLCALGIVLPQINLIILTGYYGYLANLVFVALMMIMIYAKYVDKDARGTI